METATASQDDSSEANPSSVKSEDEASPREGRPKSPPPNCAICLGRCRNKSFTDSCLHQFCFKCLVTWSKVKTECPLCKQVFKSIIHNVRSNHQYEEYPVEPPPAARHEGIDIRDLFSRRYRFRATLTMPRNESLAFQQFLMQYPMLRGNMAGGAGAAGPAGEGPRVLRRRHSPTSFRRTVYRHNLWARPLPDFTGRFRDCTPEFYRNNGSQIHRLVPWLNRELHYLLNENVAHTAYVLARILELLPQHHITSIEFRNAMRCYFGDRTEHFLHELYCFAATPYDITGYDRYVQYSTDSRISTMVQDLVSGSDSDSSADSDILMVSSSHPAETQPAPCTSAAGPSRYTTANPLYTQSNIPPFLNPSTNIIPIETISHSDTDDDSSEVMVVGYIKPPSQRTPEVVDLLGSDSDVVVQETGPEEPAPASSRADDARDSHSVKLTLSTQKRPPPEDSDSDAPYVPPPAPARRRRRPRGSSTTTDTGRDTPSPHHSNSSAYSRTASRRSNSISSTYTDSFSSSNSYSSSTSSSFDRRTGGKSKKGKNKKKLTKQLPKRSKSKAKKRSPRRQRKRSDDRMEEKSNKPSKHKSRNGKDVKSSKKSKSSKPGPSEPSPSTTEQQPGPSHAKVASKRKSGDEHNNRSNRENKRLKSVVNVMNKNDKSDDMNGVCVRAGGMKTRRMRNSSSSQPATTEETARTLHHDTTDSEDDVPLNLTLQKM